MSSESDFMFYLNNSENRMSDAMADLGHAEEQFKAIMENVKAAATIARNLLADPDLPPGEIEEMSSAILELLE